MIKMADIASRNEVLSKVFQLYDEDGQGELNVCQLQRLHADLRLGGISLPQTHAAISYVCVTDMCHVTELFDIIQELDRRYFLLQDLRWEFTFLDREQTDMITEKQARWFVQTVHGQYFSSKKWQAFLSNRAVPGSGVAFAEIEVMLCDIPNRLEIEKDESRALKEHEEKKRRQSELEISAQKEADRMRLERDERRKSQQEQRKTQEEEQGRKLEEEDKLREAEEKRLQKEEDNRKLRQEDQRRKDEEEAEEQERQRLEEQAHEQDEERRREAEMYKDVEKIAQDAQALEKEAEEQLKKATKKLQEAKDARTRAEAEDEEREAKQRKKEYAERRVRYNVKVAIKNRDKTQLESSTKQFKKLELTDDEMDLAKAERLLKELIAGEYLRKAMSKSEIQELEKAMALVKKNGVEAQLAHEMIAANKLLNRLRRLERIRHEILDLKQSTVAEIRSYQNPPPIVHTVMKATLLILGHLEKETKEWKSVQAIVGKTGKETLKRRCLGCEPGKISAAIGTKVKALLDKYELDEVRDVSAGAATFYVWATTMVEESQELIRQKSEA